MREGQTEREEKLKIRENLRDWEKLEKEPEKSKGMYFSDKSCVPCSY